MWAKGIGAAATLVLLYFFWPHVAIAIWLMWRISYAVLFGV